MSIQTIIDRAQSIEFDRRRMSSQSISRSQRIKTAERASAQPWQMNVTPPGSMNYTANRGILETISNRDRVEETEVNLSKAGYLVKYQGALTQDQLNNLTISTSTTATFTISTLPAIGTTGTIETISSTTVIFAQGDFIQPTNSRYPYSITETVVRGEGSTIVVELHRPIITSENLNLINSTLKVGSSCTWRMLVIDLPTYTVVPYDRLQWNGDFKLVEKVI